MRKKLSFFVCLVGAVGIAACASSGDNPDGPNPGADGGDSCIDGATQCDGNTFQTCSSNAWETTNQCTGLCDSNLGCVDCNPGQNYCVGDDVFSCDGQGKTQGLVETCSGGLHCSGGTCLDLCADAEANRSYIGCDYFAVDLDNAIEVVMSSAGFFGCLLAPPGTVERNDLPVCYDGENTAGECEDGGTCPAGFTCQTTPVCVLDAQGSPFAVVVSNPQGIDAQVTISNQSGQTETMTVAAGQVQSIFPQQLGFADQSLNGSGVSPNAYRIESDVPIVAYQFNPLDNVDVFSNDGSLLIPRHAYDTKYLALTWPTLTRRPDTNDYNGYVAVVAWEDNTQIEVTPTAGVRPGASFAAIAAGATTGFTLNAFEVLHFEAVADGDLTGTLIEANGSTFGVFAGHEATVIQNTSTSCCADHIEEMMFPTSTWGKDYVIARSQDRGMSEADTIRIMAQTDGTAVSVNPPQSPACPTLDAGEFCEFEIMTDVEVSATEPILIGHYLQSVIESDLFGSQGTGDPALSIAVPSEQYRNSYTFLVPNQYAMQYISVVAPAGATVSLDGNDISSSFATMGGGTWQTARIAVQPGQRKLSCSGNCGLEVYGYDDAVSYLFAGGLDLQQIVVD